MLFYYRFVQSLFIRTWLVLSVVFGFTGAILLTSNLSHATGYSGEILLWMGLLFAIVDRPNWQLWVRALVAGMLIFVALFFLLVVTRFDPLLYLLPFNFPDHIYFINHLSPEPPIDNLWFYSLRHITVGAAPIFILVFGYVFQRKRLLRWIAAGLLVLAYALHFQIAFLVMSSL